MRNIFHPSLLSLDNAMEDFMQDYKRKQGLPTESVSESDLIKSEVDLFETMSQQSGLSPASCREMFKEELSAFPKFSNEAAKEKQFMEDGARLQKQFPRKRFSVAGVIAVLAVAAFVMWFVYCSMEAF